MIPYPHKLDPIFDKLKNNRLKPVIVGGFIRDAVLEIKSKDIDIEVYGELSFEKLQDLLKEFGSVNIVGKSFGVCKLKFQEYDLDFSLPRTDNKAGRGHKGFKIDIDPSIDFKTAASRRDFTINSIGYDVIEKKILDPFDGLNDLKNKILKAVNLESFIQDPLRVLRAAQFCARFDLNIENTLFEACKDMVSKNMLTELPKERVFEEIKKLLLKSQKPSYGFRLLKEFGTDLYTQDAIVTDEIAKRLTPDSKTNLTLMLAGLCYNLNLKQTNEFILKLTHEKELFKDVSLLIEAYRQVETVSIKDISDYFLYKLAAKVKISEILILSESVYLTKNRSRRYEIGEEIYKRAKELNILNKKLPPILGGSDLLKLGFAPSEQFSKILNEAYEAQMRQKFKNHEEATFWLIEYLKTLKVLNCQSL